MIANLPVASLSNSTDFPGVIEIAPVDPNNIVTAVIATNADISGGGLTLNITTAEIASDIVGEIVSLQSIEGHEGSNSNTDPDQQYHHITSLCDYFTQIFLRDNQRYKLEEVINKIDRNNNVLTHLECAQVYLLAREREYIIDQYTFILIINALYTLSNPFNITHLTNILLVLYTIINVQPKLLQTALIINLLSIFMIIVSNVIVSFMINHALNFVLSSGASLLIAIVYIVWLHTLSILIIISCANLNTQLYKLKAIYMTFNRSQIMIFEHFFL